MFYVLCFAPVTVLPWCWGMIRQYVSILFYFLGWRHVLYVILRYSVCVWWDCVCCFPVSDPVMLVYPILLFTVGYSSSRYYPCGSPWVWGEYYYYGVFPHCVSSPSEFIFPVVPCLAVTQGHVSIRCFWRVSTYTWVFWATGNPTPSVVGTPWCRGRLLQSLSYAGGDVSARMELPRRDLTPPVMFTGVDDSTGSDGLLMPGVSVADRLVTGGEYSATSPGFIHAWSLFIFTSRVCYSVFTVYL